MSEDLQVTTAHLRQLAAKQDAAAGEIATAATAPSGVSAAMWGNHGLVCAPTNMAVGMAESARSAACAGMQSVSTDLSQKLSTSAAQYDQTDTTAGGNLDDQMHPR